MADLCPKITVAHGPQVTEGKEPAPQVLPSPLNTPPGGTIAQGQESPPLFSPQHGGATKAAGGGFHSWLFPQCHCIHCGSAWPRMVAEALGIRFFK